MMLGSVLSKTLFERRWMVFWWVFATFVTGFLLMQVLPVTREMMETMAVDAPGLVEQIGLMDMSAEGYAGSQVFGQMAILAIIFAVIFGVKILAGEEKSGVMMTQMAKPVRRRTMYVQKYVSLVLAVFVVSVALGAGTYVGAVALGEAMDVRVLSELVGMMALLAAGFGSIAFGLGAMGVGGAGVIAGFYAVVGWGVMAMSMLLGDGVEYALMLTPFYFYDTSEVVAEGVAAGDAIGLLVFLVVPFVVGLWVFCWRDLRTR